jgi:hypothetical protein
MVKPLVKFKHFAHSVAIPVKRKLTDAYRLTLTRKHGFVTIADGRVQLLTARK